VDAGLETRADPATISPAHASEMVNVRFEEGGVRKDYGFLPIGATATSRILAITDYTRFDPLSKIFVKKLLRLFRSSGGFAKIETLSGASWVTPLTSSFALANVLVKPFNTQGLLVWADGDRIHRFSEGPTVFDAIDDFPAFPANMITTDLDVPVELTLASQTSINGRWVVHYRVTLIGSGSVSLRFGYFNGSTWVEDGDAVTFSQSGINNITVFDDQEYVFNEADLFLGSKIRYRIVNISGDASAVVMGYNNATDGDPFPGCTYEFWTVPVTTFGLLSNDAPSASYVFPFEDRLIALGGNDNPQRIAWSVDGDLFNWTNFDGGAGSLSVLDAVTDPVDPMIAGGKVTDNVAAVFRKRSILRLTESGNILFAINVQDWVQNQGCESPLSVTQVPGGLFFVRHDLMPCILTPQGVQPMGASIWEELKQSQILNKEVIVAAYDTALNELYVGYPYNNAGNATTFWVFDNAHWEATQQARWRRGPAQMNCHAIAVVEEAP